MTKLKQTKSSTALARVLALPMMVGVLAGCDFASKLPDAPTTLGGYDLSEKPPSVTGGDPRTFNDEASRLPPPPPPADAIAALKAPVEDRTRAPMTEAPEKIAPPVPPAPAPEAQAAYAPLEFEALNGPSDAVASSEFVPPPLDIAEPVLVGQAPVAVAPGPVAAPDIVAYEPAPIATGPYADAPIEAYSIAAPPSLPEASQLAKPTSPLAVRNARLANGAVVRVHPVIGTPGHVSATLADEIAARIGTPVDDAEAENAPVAFDLRARSGRPANGAIAVEWRLFDADKKVIGTFAERARGDAWVSIGDEAVRTIGERLGLRVADNNTVRRATLLAAGNAEPVFSTAAVEGGPRRPVRTFVLEDGATLASAPTPRVSPRGLARMEPIRDEPTAARAPVRVASRTAPPEPVRVPAPVPTRRAAPEPVVVSQAPAAPRPPLPVQPAPRAPQVVAQAPRPVSPPPSFDTLRPGSMAEPISAPTVIASGPAPLVFRGVNGAPGDGDVALGREVGKLLAQSGARITQTPQPGALFLSAQVSKTSGANSDRIEIVWKVEDSSGESIGQVTQANDVPRGLLDNSWGEDAIYAAEGARDGIIELLQGVGALDS